MSAGPDPVVSVVIPTHDRRALLERVLRAYEGQEGAPPFELIVVDDGSTDGTAELLAAWRPSGFTLVADRQEAKGPAAARNRAIARARGRLLLITGDDIIPTPGLVRGHAEAHASARARFVLGRTAWHPDEPVNALMRHIDGIGAQQFHYAFLRRRQWLDFRFFYASNISLARATLSGIAEPFDAAFDRAAFEDADLGYRLMGERREIRYLRSLLAHHVHPHTLDSFLERQAAAGAMAAVFFEKHPEAARYFRLGELRGLALSAEQMRAGEPPDRVETVKSLARDLVRPWAEGSVDASWLDGVLIGLFRLTYAEALLERRRRRALDPALKGALLRRYLVPSLEAAVAAKECNGNASAQRLRRELAAIRERPGPAGAAWRALALRFGVAARRTAAAIAQRL